MRNPGLDPASDSCAWERAWRRGRMSVGRSDAVRVKAGLCVVLLLGPHVRTGRRQVRVRTPPPSPNPPTLVAIGYGYLWIVDGQRTVTRLDPRTYRIVGAPIR